MLRAEHFALTPVPPRRLAVGLLGAAFAGIATAVTLLAFISLVVFGARLGVLPRAGGGPCCRLAAGARGLAVAPGGHRVRPGGQEQDRFRGGRRAGRGAAHPEPVRVDAGGCRPDLRTAEHWRDAGLRHAGASAAVRMGTICRGSRRTVRLAHRGRRAGRPGVWCLARAPAVDDRDEAHDQRHRARPVVLQPVNIQRTTSAASQHGAAQPQARTGNRHPVTDLQARQLAPAQTGQRQHEHHIAVVAFARLRQRLQLVKGERLALTPSAAIGLIANRRRHVVLHPGVGHREREDGSQRGERASRGRRR